MADMSRRHEYSRSEDKPALIFQKIEKLAESRGLWTAARPPPLATRRWRSTREPSAGLPVRDPPDVKFAP